MSVRVIKLEVRPTQADATAMWNRWHDLAKTVQQITNCIWETWLVWHVQNRTAEQQRDFLDRFAEWKKRKSELPTVAQVTSGEREYAAAVKAFDKLNKSVRKSLSRTVSDEAVILTAVRAAWEKALIGDKPKSEVTAIPKKLDKLIYDTLAKEFPAINTTARELIRNAVCQKIKTRKAATGNLPGWAAIVLRNESIPSSTRSQPIPFSKKNAVIVPPQEKGGRFGLKLRIDRFEKPGKKAGGSHEDHIELITNRRGVWQHAEKLKQIASGDLEFCGSSLQWDRKKSKWFALICYKAPDIGRPAIAVDVTATRCPGRGDPRGLIFGASMQ